ncbi:MAG: GNAT family N-acetyltransferase [Mycobacteriales bacterium]
MTDDVVVRVATAEEILALRMSVLRPGWELSPSDYDQSPHPRHVAAFAGDEVLGCASVFPSPYEDVADAWQLRGMAVSSQLQGTGIGARVLLGAIDIAREAGEPLLWAHARVSALGFYRRLGFDVVGEEYRHGPLELPHKIIRLTL